MPHFVRPNSEGTDLTEIREDWSDAARKAAAAARRIRKAGGSKQAQQRGAMKAYLSATPRSRRGLLSRSGKYGVSANTHRGLATAYGKASYGFKKSYRNRADKVKSARHSRRERRQDTMRHMFSRAASRAKESRHNSQAA